LKVASAVHVTELLPENAATLGNISFEPGTLNWKKGEIENTRISFHNKHGRGR